PTILRLTSSAWAAVGCGITYRFFLARRPSLPFSKILAMSFSTVIWFGPLLGWWTLTARPDIAAACLELAALGYLATHWETLSPRSAFTGGVLCFLAWSFKQTDVSVLLAAALLLGRERKPKRAAVFVGTFLFLALIPSAFLGQAYWHNTFIAP